MASSDLVKAGDFGLIALDPDNEVQQILEESLAGESVGMGDLKRIKWPTGGATKFECSVLGNTEYVETIQGVIVHTRMGRSYWQDPNPVEGQSPDCSSPDGEWGYGQPGDELRALSPPQGCATCPMAAFGSSKNPNSPNSQACKLSRDLFVLTPGETFPLLVSIPPGSLGEVRSFLVDLASHGIRYSNVVVELSLEKATSKASRVTYAQARCKMVGRLDPESVEGVERYKQMVVSGMTQTRAQAEPAAAEVEPKA